MTPDYDAALLAAADRHMSRGSNATANVEMDVERDGAVFLAEVCVEEGTVSWADITGEYVEDADGRVLVAQAADLAVHPASVSKVPTSLALLRKLGPEHRFVTRFVSRGAVQDGTLRGDLGVEADGDPFFVDENALVVVLSDHGFRAWPEARVARDLSSKARFLSGNHREKATLIVSGPQVRRSATVDRRITHLDVLPTLLFALDAPRARDNAGQPLVELFTEELVAARPDRWVASYAPEAAIGSAQAKAETKRSALDGEILEELRALGYIR